MKKFGILTAGLLTLFWLVMTVSVLAHPPSDIKINYNPKTQLLSITVDHQVENPKPHYIKEIEVFLNGKKIILQNFNQQAGQLVQVAIYQVYGLIPGDKIGVEAECSRFGSLRKDFKI